MKNLKKHTRIIAFMAVLGILGAHGNPTDPINPTPASIQPTEDRVTLRQLLPVLLPGISLFNKKEPNAYTPVYLHRAPQVQMLRKSGVQNVNASSESTESDTDSINLSPTDKKMAAKVVKGFGMSAWADIQPIVTETFHKYMASILRIFR